MEKGRKEITYFSDCEMRAAAVQKRSRQAAYLMYLHIVAYPPKNSSFCRLWGVGARMAVAEGGVILCI